MPNFVLITISQILAVLKNIVELEVSIVFLAVALRSSESVIHHKKTQVSNKSVTKQTVLIDFLAKDH